MSVIPKRGTNREGFLPSSRHGRAAHEPCMPRSRQLITAVLIAFAQGLLVSATLMLAMTSMIRPSAIAAPPVELVAITFTGAALLGAVLFSDARDAVHERWSEDHAR